MGTSLTVTVVTVTGTPPSPFLAAGCEPLLVQPIGTSAASARQPARSRKVTGVRVFGLGTKRRMLLSLEMALFRPHKLHCLAGHRQPGRRSDRMVTKTKGRSRWHTCGSVWEALSAVLCLCGVWLGHPLASVLNRA